MMCDGSGELKYGWACRGCDNCHPAPRYVAVGRPSGRRGRPYRPATDPCPWCKTAHVSPACPGSKPVNWAGPVTPEPVF